MTQTYAARVKKRPAYRRYKNRKQHLRRQWQDGKINYEQRAQAQAQARAEYLADTQATNPSEILEAWIRGTYYLEIGGDLADPESFRDGHCNEGCVGAKGRLCVCYCHGLNHGLAVGTDLSDVAHATLAEMRRDDPEAALLHGVI